MSKRKFNFAVSAADTPKTSMPETLPAASAPSIFSAKTVVPEENYLKTRLIPREKIRPNPKNKYEMKNIDSLADSILHYGLMQPLVVIYITEDDTYMLETGHRRAAALNKLIQTYSSWDGEADDPDYLSYCRFVKIFEKGFPCSVSAHIDDGVNYDSDDLSSLSPDVIRSEIRLHLTNSEVRDIDRARTVQRLSVLYQALNEGKPKSEKINVNEQIANDLQITARQVINYKNVSKLIPELQNAFDQKKITLKESSKISQLDPDDQQQILDLIDSESSKAELQKSIQEKLLLNESLKKLHTDLEQRKKELAQIQNEKELLLQQLDSAQPDPSVNSQIMQQAEKELSKKDLEICELKKQLQNVQQQKKDFSVHASSVQAALNLKNSLSESYRVIQELLSALTAYQAAPSSLLTDDEIRHKLAGLHQLLHEIPAAYTDH